MRAECTPFDIAAARLLGFEIEEAEDADAPTSATPSRPVQPPRPVPTLLEQARGMPHWLIEAATPDLDRGSPERPKVPEEQALGPNDIGRVPGSPAPPPWPSLVAWSRLRRVLERAWSRPLGSGAIDLDAVVHELGRARPLRQIPRKPRRVGGARVFVVLDLATRLTAFFNDQLELLDRLVHEFGHDIDRTCVWREGPPSHVTDAEALAAIDPGLAHDDVVLVLGDLGLYAAADTKSATQHDWWQLGLALRRRGVRLLALVPCPAHRWSEPGLLRCWNAVDWTQPEHTSRQRNNLDPRQSVARLLALLSWLVYLEPGLVRAIRLRLGDTQADVGTEADVWNMPGTHPDASGLMLSIELRLAAQRDLLALMDDEAALLHDIVSIVRRHHASLRREVWLEEARMLELLAPGCDWITPEERDAASVLTGRALTRLRNPAASPRLAASINVAGWALDAHTTRIPERGWTHPTMGPALIEIGHTLGRTHELVPGQRASTVLGVVDDGPLRVWEVRQVGAALRIMAPVSSDAGAVICRIGAGGLIGINERVVPLPHDIEAEAGARVVLESKCESVTLRFAPLPEWAKAGGRDRHGVWAALRVGEVEQRMRWIPPGRFVMGSPDTEVGRWDDEGPQHEVTFTTGFWLADTPCTQALWVAVMGMNPSRFQSPKRPVENVSWNEAHEFISRLRDCIPDLDAELPSEARWEYACRAGTNTATYMGGLDIRGERDAPILDEIAWYGGNSGHHGFDLDDQGYDSSDWPEKQYPDGRAATREVATRRANPWGLYDMLGNVWEWCEDTDGNYEATPIADPRPWRHGQGRVSRGGSWSALARDVRATHRCWLGPGDRLERLGFRLAVGQGLREEAENQSRDRATQGQE